MIADRKPLDAVAFALMVVLCMMWGFQQVTIKWTAPDISLVMQAGLRSTIATALLLVWARVRRVPLFDRDGTNAISQQRLCIRELPENGGETHERKPMPPAPHSRMPEADAADQPDRADQHANDRRLRVYDRRLGTPFVCRQRV